MAVIPHLTHTFLMLPFDPQKVSENLCFLMFSGESKGSIVEKRVKAAHTRKSHIQQK